MTYDETFKFKLSTNQLNKINALAEQGGVSIAEVVRHAIDIVGAEDSVVVSLSMKEKQFIEGICETLGVQPSDAVKVVLLAYQTLMRSPLWKIVKPVDEILDEIKDEENERARLGESNRKG